MKTDLDALKRIHAADKLLLQDTTSRQKFDALRKLIKGLNPNLDKALIRTSKALKKVEQVQKKKVIDLTVENLPEKTDQQKKRKKALLLFWKNWKQLKSEVKRMEKEIKKQQSKDTTTQDKIKSGSKILRTLKGPLGIVTIAATGIAAVLVTLNTRAAEVTIHNQNCPAIDLSLPTSVNLPGLKIPQTSIMRGSSTTITLPPLTVDIDATNPNAIQTTILGQTFTTNLNRYNINQITLNNNRLIGKSSTIKLNRSPNNQVVITCN